VTVLATEVGIASHVPRCMTAPLRGPQQEVPFGLDCMMYLYVPQKFLHLPNHINALTAQCTRLPKR
jgi:hypothetical protein